MATSAKTNIVKLIKFTHFIKCAFNIQYILYIIQHTWLGMEIYSIQVKSKWAIDSTVISCYMNSMQRDLAHLISNWQTNIWRTVYSAAVSVDGWCFTDHTVSMPRTLIILSHKALPCSETPEEQTSQHSGYCYSNVSSSAANKGQFACHF